MVWGGRREDGSGCGTRVYLWQIHVDIWQNQYNIVKLKNKVKKKIKKRKKKKKREREIPEEKTHRCLLMGVHQGENDDGQISSDT